MTAVPLFLIMLVMASFIPASVMAETNRKLVACASAIEERWNKIENAVWLAICETGKAQLEDRQAISGTFLATVLRDKMDVGRIAQFGVRIVGGEVDGELWADDLEVDVPITLEDMRFNSSVRLSNSFFGGYVSVDGSVFEAPLAMDGARIQRHFMARAATFKTLDLRNARIDGPLYMSGSQVAGELNLMRVSIARSLTLDTPAKHTSSLDQSLPWNVRQAKFRGPVILQAAEIGHLLDMRGSVFGDNVDLQRLKTGKSLLMRSNTHFFGAVIAHGASVQGSLDIRGSIFEAGLDLSYATVGEDFRIGRGDCNICTGWGTDASITLVNAKFNSIQDMPCELDDGQDLSHWPHEIQFTGLRYELLSGYNQTATEAIASRKASWFEHWLDRQPEFSPQPYRHLAKVLTDQGYEDTAVEVMTAGKNRELWETQNRLRQLNLFLQKLFIGYGLQTGLVALWVLFLSVLGAEVLRRTQECADKTVLHNVFYSFDRLIPIVKLSDEHYKPELVGWPRYYFFIHTLVGFVLGSYLLAALTGVAG